MNFFARQSLVHHVQSQPDYTAFAQIPSFSQPNIHGSGHFGLGGIFGHSGKQSQSRGDPLFYLHHGNLDRILWEWQLKDLPARLHQVSGLITAFDYDGQNVTLDFQINLGKVAPNAPWSSSISEGYIVYDY